MVLIGLERSGICLSRMWIADPASQRERPRETQGEERFTLLNLAEWASSTVLRGAMLIAGRLQMNDADDSQEV
jgi:hypothetical protein